MSLIKQYKLTLVTLVVLVVLAFINIQTATDAVVISLDSTWTMLGILPPILILMNLLDAYIPKDVVLKHMGKDSGLTGFFWAFVLGTFAAGPLYVAFPIAALLAKKNARMAYLIFFLGMWTVTKLPVATYELNFFGLPFTLLHMLTGIVFFLGLSLVLEKVFQGRETERIYQSLARM
jgi:uncharacterized membrane protein YraQ (UPF0718 family)